MASGINQIDESFHILLVMLFKFLIWGPLLVKINRFWGLRRLYLLTLKGKELGDGAGKVLKLTLLEPQTSVVKDKSPLHHPDELLLAHL